VHFGASNAIAAHRQAAQEQGKLTARERIELLLDPGSFVELDKLRHAPLPSTSAWASSGSPATASSPATAASTAARSTCSPRTSPSSAARCPRRYAQKICKVMDLAMKVGAPVIGLNDSGGARIQEGVASLAGYAEIFLRNTLASGVIPQISAILGPCAGGAVYSPAITDFIVMVEGHELHVHHRPRRHQDGHHEDVTKEELGGARARQRSQRRGALRVPTTSRPPSHAPRELLSYLPQNNAEDPPAMPTDDDPTAATRRSRRWSRRPEQALRHARGHRAVVDDDTSSRSTRTSPRTSSSASRASAAAPVGIVANQPAVLAGCLDINASVKAARFVRFCDCFNIPLVTFVDVPGFLPGTNQEYGGIIRHGAKLLYAYAEATVPKITVITRKAYGGAYDVMASKHIRADVNLAFPTAEIAVMGPDGAVNIIFRASSRRPPTRSREKAELVAEYREKFANPFKAAELGYIDEVIVPVDLRPKLIRALEMLGNKRETMPPKKHGNIPL
jgi:propionyl-CoA carboxylase beta chain